MTYTAELNAARPDYWRRAKITHEMADSRREHWESVLAPYRRQVRRVLEVGSYEGQSALFWHFYFGAEVYCVDNWQHVAHGCKNAAEVEAHFDANVRGLPIMKCKAESSTEALLRLGGGFDLAYIDGDHSRVQVLIDTCLAWRALRVGGIIIWDDYRDYRPDLADRPASAIDAFVAMMAGELELLADTGQQLFARRAY